MNYSLASPVTRDSWSSQAHLLPMRESAPAGKRSVANVRAGELLIEALELAASEQDRIDEYYASVREAQAQVGIVPGSNSSSDDDSGSDGGQGGVHVGRSNSSNKGKAGQVPMPKAKILMLGRTPLQHVVHHLLLKPVQLTEALFACSLCCTKCSGLWTP